MSRIRKLLASLLLVLVGAFPSVVGAVNVFGGKVSVQTPCFVPLGTWNKVGSPRGGSFIYSAGSTKKYPFGAPKAGRWTLGLYGIPTFCIVTIAPLVVFTGKLMTMEASSN